MSWNVGTFCVVTLRPPFLGELKRELLLVTEVARFKEYATRRVTGHRREPRYFRVNTSA